MGSTIQHAIPIAVEPSPVSPAKTAARPAAPAVADQEPSMGRTVPFRAEVDIAELDEQDRPGPAWQGRISEISRSHVAILSRRMCYCGRRLVLTVPATEGEPRTLRGEVESCEYKSAGMHRTVLVLREHPDEEAPRRFT